MVDVEKSRVECEEFVAAEVDHDVFSMSTMWAMRLGSHSRCWIPMVFSLNILEYLNKPISGSCKSSVFSRGFLITVQCYYCWAYVDIWHLLTRYVSCKQQWLCSTNLRHYREQTSTLKPEHWHRAIRDYKLILSIAYATVPNARPPIWARGNIKACDECQGPVDHRSFTSIMLTHPKPVVQAWVWERKVEKDEY